MLVFIKLIAAHLIGDFLLQSDRMCRLKYGKNLFESIVALLIHSCIQALLSYAFIGEWKCWQLPVIIGVSHFLIDFVKVKSGKRGFVPFVLDQLAHYAVLFAAWKFLFDHCGYLYYPADSFMSLSAWMILTSYIAVLVPTSILIKNFIEYEQWVPEDASSRGLPNAGKWIGYIERVLILTFIFTGNVEGIGFLLAAKSVFRFGDLNKASDIKVTEYVLIGTFASFAVAIMIGFVVKWSLTLLH